MRIDSPSLVGTTTITGSAVVTGSITPGTNALYDLGSSSKRWNSIFASNISGSLTGSNVSAGQVVLAGTGGVLSGTNNLFWNNTSTRLGIGTSSPSYALEVLNGGQVAIGIGTATAPSTRGTFVAGDKLILQTDANNKRVIGNNNTGYGIYFQNDTVDNDGFTFIEGNSAITNVTRIKQGKVGIGTSTPADQLTVATGNVQVPRSAYVGSSATGNAIVIGTSGGSQIGFPQVSSNDEISFVTHTSGVSHAERMRINAAGNVGIGTTNPGYKFTIAGTGGVIATDNNASFVAKNTSGTYESWVYPRQSDGLMYIDYAASGLRVRNSAGTVTTLAADNSGNVGLGTATPSQKLHVYNGYAYFENGYGIKSGGEILLEGNGTNTNIKITTLSAAGSYPNAKVLYVTNPSSELLTVLNSGNVGIGSASPGDKLSVNGAVSVTGSLQPGTSNTYTLGSSSKLWSTIYATNLSGSLTRLGDGTSYLIAGTNVTITTGSTGAVTISASAAAGTLSGAGTANYIPKYTTSTTLGDSVIYDAGTSIGIGTTNTNGNKLSISGGNLSVTGSILPGVTSTYDLGSSTYYWRDVYARSGSYTGDVTISGNLTVAGTQTIVNSTTVNIGDNIILLNSTASPQQYGGIYVADTTANTTGSLRWNSSTDKWEAGLAGSEVALPTGTGTAAYVARWTGTNTLGTGILYDDSATVAAGTTTTSGGSGNTWVEGRLIVANSANSASIFLPYPSISYAGFKAVHSSGNASGASDFTDFRMRPAYSSGIASGTDVNVIRFSNTYARNFPDVLLVPSGGYAAVGVVPSPSAQFTVSGSSTSATPTSIFKSGVSSPTGAIIDVQGNTGTTLMHVSGSGFVGIGTLNASQLLHLHGGSLLINTTGTGTNNDIFMGRTGGWGTGETHSLNVYYNGPTVGGTTIGGTMEFQFDGSKQNVNFRNLYNSGTSTAVLMTIQGNGNVGIGTSTAAVRFAVSGSTTTSTPTAVIRSGISSPTAPIFEVQDSLGNTLFNVTGSGNVGIGFTRTSGYVDDRLVIGSLGTASPFGIIIGESYAAGSGKARLGLADANRGIGLSALDHTVLHTYSTNSILFGHGTPTSLTERMRIDSSGNVGINTTSMSLRLEVSGSDARIHDVRVGRGAGSILTNTVVGNGSLASNTSGIYNTAVGFSALPANTTANYNTAVGTYAIYRSVSASYNTGIGMQAVCFGTGGSNTGVGALSLQGVDGQTTSTNNTAIGYASGYSTTTGGNNFFGGHQAGFSQSVATQNVYVGAFAGYLTTSGSNNVAVGYNAGYSETTGTQNVWIGASAGQNQTAKSRNVIIGFNAGVNALLGNDNVIVGRAAVDNGYTDGSVIVGVTAARNVTGNNNVAVGANALEGATGSTTTATVAVGYQSLYRTTTSSNNTATGYQSGFSVTSGGSNTFMGYRAGYVTSVGSNNTFIGNQAGVAVTSGSNNTFIGNTAGQSATLGDNNVFLGFGAGNTLTTGTNNIYLGVNTVGSGVANTNETVIGFTATGRGSNTTTIGNGSITLTLIPSGSLALAGTAAGTNAVSLGLSNSASSNYTVALGQSNTANNTNAVAIGRSNTSSGTDSTAIGAGNISSGTGTAAIGASNTSSGTQSVAAGFSNTASNFFSIALGAYNASSGFYSFAAGGTNTASGTSSVAMGQFSLASGAQSIAMGNASTGSFPGTIAIGSGSLASSTESIALGTKNTASGPNAVSIGNNSTASFTGSISIGAFNTASGQSAAAIGGSNTASGGYGFAAGYNSTASGFGSIAMGGGGNVANTAFAMAFGSTNTSSGVSAIAMGQYSLASGAQSVAIGSYVTGSNTSAVAMGASSVASGQNSVSIGTSNTANAQLSTALGGISNTASGVYAVAVGAYNLASGASSFVSGLQTTAYLNGQRSHSAGYFAAGGDAQISTLVARNSTTNSSATELFLNAGATLRAVLPASTTWDADITIVGRASTGTSHASFRRRCLISRDGSNNTSLVGSVQVIGSDIGSNVGSPPAGWDVTVSADDTNESLKISVTGAAATNIRWVARIELVEVGY